MARHHALERSLAALTIGMVKRVRDREASLAEGKLTERQVQFQIPMSGTAYQGVAWTKRHLHFDVTFHGATGDRDVPYNAPQVYSGFVIDPSDEKAPVLPIIPTVAVQWIKDDQEATTGCILHVGVHSPTPEPVEFEGYLHVTFQGWGSPRQDATDEGD